MKNKKNATYHSRNGNSKKTGSKTESKKMSGLDLFVLELVKKGEENPLLECVMEIGSILSKNVGNKFEVLDNMDGINQLLDSLACPDLSYYENYRNVENMEIHKTMFYYSFYSICARHGVNLESLETENDFLKGLNEFLLKESPETYNAYDKVSVQFKFNTIIRFRMTDCNGKNMMPGYDLKNPSMKNEELLELDESLEIENSIGPGRDVSNPNSGDNVCSEVNLAKLLEDDFIGQLFLIAWALQGKIKDEPNESNQIDEILSSLGNLIGSRCKYRLDEQGEICYIFKDNETYIETPESGLVCFLGVLACFKINLELLELQNPELLNGLNAWLIHEFYDIYDGYSTLSNQFGFKNTVKLQWNSSSVNQELVDFLQVLRVEQQNPEFNQTVMKESEGRIESNTLEEGTINNDEALVFKDRVRTKIPLKSNKQRKAESKLKDVRTKKANSKLEERLSSNISLN